MKRLKGKNFSDKEINLILDIIEKYIQIIENKKTDGTTIKEKNYAWVEIAQEFNANSDGEERSPSQLKNFYDNFKRKKRKDNADDKAELYKTGGGSYIKKIDSSGERFINLLKEQFEPDKNIYDSAANYHDSQNFLINQNVNTYNLDDNITINNISHTNFERTSNEKNSSILVVENEKKNEAKEESKVYTALPKTCEERKASFTNNNNNKDRKKATTVYNALENLTKSKTLKKNYENDYLKLKLAYKTEQLERKREENIEAKQLFLLQKQKLENEIKLQEIKIKQELVQLEKMKDK